MIGLPEGGGEKGEEFLFELIMAENFSKLG